MNAQRQEEYIVWAFEHVFQISVAFIVADSGLKSITNSAFNLYVQFEWSG